MSLTRELAPAKRLSAHLRAQGGKAHAGTPTVSGGRVLAGAGRGAGNTEKGQMLPGRRAASGNTASEPRRSLVPLALSERC